MNLPACDVCGKAITVKDGALAVEDFEAVKRLEAIRVGEQEHLPPKDARGMEALRTPEMRRRIPGLLDWRVGHRMCVQDGAYCIDLERFDEPEKVLAWTKHLWWRVWFRATDWWAAVERLHGRLDA
jgi:hypothetical protein